MSGRNCPRGEMSEGNVGGNARGNVIDPFAW